MDSINYKVVNQKGKEVGTIELDARVFGAPVSTSLIHDTIVWQRNNRRAGTHSVLTKGVMKGGNRKPWRQKGTGRARAGSNTSPIWVGGAVAHGPKPRSYETRVPKRTRRQALAAALTEKVRQNQLLVVDSLGIDSGKTKDMADFLEKVGVSSKKTLIVFSDAEMKDSKSWRAARNLASTTPVKIEGINVFELMRREFVVCSQEGLKALQQCVIQRMTGAEE